MTDIINYDIYLHNKKIHTLKLPIGVNCINKKEVLEICGTRYLIIQIIPVFDNSGVLEYIKVRTENREYL